MSKTFACYLVVVIIHALMMIIGLVLSWVYSIPINDYPHECVIRFICKTNKQNSMVNFCWACNASWYPYYILFLIHCWIHLFDYKCNGSTLKNLCVLIWIKDALSRRLFSSLVNLHKMQIILKKELKIEYVLLNGKLMV